MIDREFRVDEIDGDIGWLTLMHGSKAGLQYGMDISDVDLEVGDREQMAVEPLNDDETAWKVVEVLRPP